MSSNSAEDSMKRPTNETKLKPLACKRPPGHGCSVKQSNMSVTITQLILFFTLCFPTVKSVPNTNPRSVLCNSGEFTGGDPFAISLTYVLEELQNEMPTRQNYDYYNISPYPNAFAYGHATCNKNLTSPDCRTCLGAANATVAASCGRRIGGRALLFDCSMRYEQYPFKE